MANNGQDARPRIRTCHGRGHMDDFQLTCELVLRAIQLGDDYVANAPEYEQHIERLVAARKLTWDQVLDAKGKD